MVEIKKMMQRNTDGTSDQYYPETHVMAVLGLSDLVKNTPGNNSGGSSGVSSINGKTGIVFVTKEDLGIVLATSTSDGLLSRELYQKIQELVDSPASSNTKSDISAELINDSIYQLLYKKETFNPKQRSMPLKV